MKVISAGEIKKGLFIAAYESLEPKISPSFFGLPIIPDNENEKFQVNLFPWFKSIPFEVLDVAGPFIAIKTNSMQLGGTKLNPVIFFDARITHFIEVDKEFYDTYWQAVGINV